MGTALAGVAEGDAGTEAAAVLGAAGAADVAALGAAGGLVAGGAEELSGNSIGFTTVNPTMSAKTPAMGKPNFWIGVSSRLGLGVTPVGGVPPAVAMIEEMRLLCRVVEERRSLGAERPAQVALTV